MFADYVPNIVGTSTKCCGRRVTGPLGAQEDTL